MVMVRLTCRQCIHRPLSDGTAGVRLSATVLEETPNIESDLVVCVDRCRPRWQRYHERHCIGLRVKSLSTE